MELLRILPKAWLSFILGKLLMLELPEILAAPLVRAFARFYAIDTESMEFPLSHYKSISALFTRRLRAGSRPIGAEPVSPVDGTIRTIGRIQDHFAEQVKSIQYSLIDLLQDEVEAKRFLGGSYINLYLSPQDYHHVHSPVGGTVRKMSHIPGTLWPVNDWSVKAIKNLFTINERIVTYLTTAHGEVAVVMIGATNVGKMSLSYDPLVTNQTPWADGVVQHTKYPEHIALESGSLLGTFHLGSSVVVLFDSQYTQEHPIDLSPQQRTIRYGRTLAAQGR